MDRFEHDLAAIGRIDVVPKILEVICRTTGMGFAAVARVTEDRWIACAVHDEIAFGLKPGGELAVVSTICNEIRASGEPVLIDHVAGNDAFRDHHTPRQYGFQSYVSVPILHRGAFFGTLCAIDPKPAKVETPETRAMFELFADLIARHLDAQDALDRSQAALSDAEETAKLRDQFIAVLGHDLRNPLAAIDAGVRKLGKAERDPEDVRVLAMMAGGVDRMAGLIGDVLDLAKGQLGSGVDVEVRPDVALEPALRQVIAELRATRPDRAIEAEFAALTTVACDERRIAQLVSNLLTNAIVHGADSGVIRMRAGVVGGVFELSVSNPGPTIPPAARRRLFLPFTRAIEPGASRGLGLGLYIASQIARAHGGDLDVASGGGETRFTFTMPVD